MLRDYYSLSKPGIVYGNALTAAAGFFFGSHFGINVPTLLMMLVGNSAIVAAGCVFNNYLDRDIDARMERTKFRALVSGNITPYNALVFAFVLLCVGIAALYVISVTTLLVALFGLFVYA